MYNVVASWISKQFFILYGINPWPDWRARFALFVLDQVKEWDPRLPVFQRKVKVILIPCTCYPPHVLHWRASIACLGLSTLSRLVRLTGKLWIESIVRRKCTRLFGRFLNSWKWNRQTCCNCSDVIVVLFVITTVAFIALYFLESCCTFYWQK